MAVLYIKWKLFESLSHYTIKGAILLDEFITRSRFQTNKR